MSGGGRYSPSNSIFSRKQDFKKKRILSPVEYRFVPTGACGTCTGKAGSLDYEVHEKNKKRKME
jgi:hypothetical protein